MRKLIKQIRLILSILGLFTAGCTVDLNVSRGKESLSLHIKPTTRPADDGGDKTRPAIVSADAPPLH